TRTLIAINCVAFLYEVTLGPDLRHFIAAFGLVPARFTDAIQSTDVQWGAAITPFFTSMFLHGGWMHLIGNMWYLLIFGDNVHDRLGHVGFLVFYLAAGVFAAAVHVAAAAHSTLPTVGASGAIAGVLGPYAVGFPSARG